jgi:beta-N-acetylhexosaminidase
VTAIDEERPATLSRRIVEDLLRGEVGHRGVVFTDDLDMKAISARYSAGEAVVAAIAAGCDGCLLCGEDHERQFAALDAVVRAIEDERLPVRRVEEALDRHRRMKERFLPPVPPRPLDARALRDVLGRAGHRLVAEEMARYV